MRQPRSGVGRRLDPVAPRERGCDATRIAFLRGRGCVLSGRAGRPVGCRCRRIGQQVGGHGRRSPYQGCGPEPWHGDRDPVGDEIEERAGRSRLESLSGRARVPGPDQPERQTGVEPRGPRPATAATPESRDRRSVAPPVWMNAPGAEVDLCSATARFSSRPARSSGSSARLPGNGANRSSRDPVATTAPGEVVRMSFVTIATTRAAVNDLHTFGP